MGYLEYGLALAGLYLVIGLIVAMVTKSKPPPAVQRSKMGRMLKWPLVVAGK